MLARNVSAEGRSRAFVGGASVPVADARRGRRAAGGRARPVRPAPAAPGPRPARGAGPVRRRAPLAALLATYADLHRRARGHRARARRGRRDRPRAGPGGRPAAVRARRDRGRRRPSRARTRRWRPRRPGSGFADTLRTAAEQAREALSSEQGDPDALATTSAARTLLDGVREHDAEAGELADRLAEVTYLLSDLAADVASYAARIETDPARLAAVSERRAALTALTRKYGDTIDEVLAWAERSATRLLDLDDTDERIEELRGRAGAPARELGAAAAALSAARTEAAGAAGRRGHRRARPAGDAARPAHDRGRQHECRPAATTGRCWSTALAAHTASGVDEVELLLAANTGSEPRPLNKGASGGELSRVMLALEVALAGTSPVPTFVFDEVDAGVGGAAAVEVGRRLAQLARTAQVLVVTHLPQVAAYADRHVVVEKSSDGSVTSSGPDRPRRRPARARAVPDAGRAGRLRHRAGPRPRAARGRPGGRAAG